MKTQQSWEFMGSWPADGLCHERGSYVFRWNSGEYVIAGSIKADGAATYNIYQWTGLKEDGVPATDGHYRLIEYGFTTLHRAKGFVDRYHAGLVSAIQ